MLGATGEPSLLLCHSSSRFGLWLGFMGRRVASHLVKQPLAVHVHNTVHSPHNIVDLLPLSCSQILPLVPFNRKVPGWLRRRFSLQAGRTSNCLLCFALLLFIHVVLHVIHLFLLVNVDLFMGGEHVYHRSSVVLQQLGTLLRVKHQGDILFGGRAGREGRRGRRFCSVRRSWDYRRSLDVVTEFIITISLHSIFSFTFRGL